MKARGHISLLHNRPEENWGRVTAWHGHGRPRLGAVFGTAFVWDETERVGHGGGLEELWSGGDECWPV